MKVILRTDVAAVGRAGDVKEVAPGFGRNFLLPRGMAMLATPSAMRWWEKGKERRAKLAERKSQLALGLAGKVAGTTLSFARPVGAEGKLYGSVGKSDIVKSLKTCGFDVDKAAVALDEAIKKTGEYEVELKFRPGVSAKIKVSVVARE
ncbi:MAG: 50S ribosomal protein L9 [Elusimicrobia bacterium]|nr:50S ribosomal protein L9 [Elusimicrobiota bacterium]